MDYLRRAIDQELDKWLPFAPAFAIDGPKGVGKTVTAARRADVEIYLDDPLQLEILESDPRLQSFAEGTVLLDEWQRLPYVWDAVRRHVDRGAPAGRFLLTGSATPHDSRGTHSGAGRILSVRMRPMALFERGVVETTVSFGAIIRGETPKIGGQTPFVLADYLHEIGASGFPGIRRMPDALRSAQLDTYIQRVIDRDLPELGFFSRRPETLRRWMAAYGAASSTTASYTKIMSATTDGDGEQPAKSTALAYRDHLAQIWLLDEVPGWQPLGNELGRLGQAPKHQLADPALALRLLNLDDRELLTSRGAPLIGPLFESLATLSIRVAAQSESARVGHLRTRNGDREVDLIVEGQEGQIVAVEVKLAATVGDEDVRHLLWLRRQLGDRIADLVIITTGEYAYRRRDGIVVVPLSLLGQ
ncbi:ATP-binding protein [Gulosibacter molinativorax]|uniref:ATP-binding protein n=1 Tax=Gulosibacter molinativorax TaxID=256821 RepID=A0ABT7C8L1_9MICO|nr:DUF4143 domain-containing protein [Gulosibacter molinativorax]MDJ1371430.1 ATP-binding protein [Gulosibacter molinativorax]QUY62928.1 AAA family ATPase [Gulosibacter molinativorax]